MSDNTLIPFLNWLNRISDDKYEKPQLIQTLWSGYGACFRAFAVQSGEPVVVKCVKPEQASSHPKGWKTSVSHARKLRSFEVEHYFYQHLREHTDKGCPVPRYLGGCQEQDSHLIVLEDLDAAGFQRRESVLTPAQCRTVLRWLAEFHASFISVSDNNVWEEGTYWHLPTRKDEWKVMEDGELKNKAQLIADKLKQARYQTLLHGDAKVANFCFSHNLKRCAAVDFQYTGYGVGVKDVAYFLGSALTEKEQVTSTDACLEIYFDALRDALATKQPAIDAQALIAEWRDLYNLACADFYRFLAGWSPEHWKLNRPLSDACESALNGL